MPRLENEYAASWPNARTRAYVRPALNRPGTGHDSLAPEVVTAQRSAAAVGLEWLLYGKRCVVCRVTVPAVAVQLPTVEAKSRLSPVSRWKCHPPRQRRAAGCRRERSHYSTSDRVAGFQLGTPALLIALAEQPSCKRRRELDDRVGLHPAGEALDIERPESDPLLTDVANGPHATMLAIHAMPSPEVPRM